MGKVQKKSSDKVKSTSKFANADYEPQNAKERVEHELQLLHARKKIVVGKQNSTVSKVKKAPVKRGISAKKQKKIARALVVLDKEEKRIESTKAKQKFRNVIKQA